METSAVEEQLFGPDPTTEYTVEEIGETVIVLSVEPLLQRQDDAPDAVKVINSPEQILESDEDITTCWHGIEGQEVQLFQQTVGI